MASKILNRSIRRHLHAAVIWAMAPLAAVSGQSVLGCMSANGQFDLNCRCWAVQPNASQPGSTDQAAAVTCHCHCGCCGTAHCCCKNKSHASNSLASHTNRTSGEGIQTTGHCRPVAMFLAVAAVNGSHDAGVEHLALNALMSSTADISVRANNTGGERIAELATGPPPDNLVVALHRWVI
jgi:hypothetical protein